MFGGAFIRRGLCTERHLRFQIGYAYNGREICVLKSTGLAYSWKLIYVSNLQRCFTEIRLEDVDLSALSHAKTMSILKRRKTTINGGNLWSTVLQPKDDDDRDFCSWAIVV